MPPAERRTTYAAAAHLIRELQPETAAMLRRKRVGENEQYGTGCDCVAGSCDSHNPGCICIAKYNFCEAHCACGRARAEDRRQAALSARRRAPSLSEEPMST